MSVSLPDRPAASRTDAARHPGHARGRLTVADRVVEKIAAEAVLDVGNVTGVGRRLPGRRQPPAGAGRRPRVSARVGQGTARISISLAVGYPVRIMEICGMVRKRVSQQIADLVGLRVTHLDIDVSAFETDSEPSHRVR